MLGGNPGGVTLTENYAMLPTSAVSGFYFGHRDSQYFGVARIGQRPARRTMRSGAGSMSKTPSAGCGRIWTSALRRSTAGEKSDSALLLPELGLPARPVAVPFAELGPAERTRALPG